jgi:predicted acetyltransferase
MDLELRKVARGEEEEFIASIRVPFLDPATHAADQADWLDRAIRGTELDRSWVVVDAGRFVANSGIDTLDVTLPAAPGEPCPVIPMGGVTRVGVHPTHRRRGLLRRLMTEMLDDSRARGEAIAGLMASESVIYGRFGFGLATEVAEYTIDSREAAFIGPVPRLDLHLVGKDEAAKRLPDLCDRHRLGRAGEPSRPPIAWEGYIADEVPNRHGGNPLFFAVCDDGYVSYRAHEGSAYWQRERLVVEELRGLTPEVEAGLWQFVFGIDLIDEVTAKRRPVDEQLRWRLADPRQLRQTQLDDRLYVRVLDVKAAFEARGYRVDDRLVLEVTPPPVDGGAKDTAPGTWVIDARDGAATCQPAGPAVSPDLRLDVTTLGSLYVGAFPASLLAAAGRIEQLRPGTLERADRLFGTWPAPSTVTGF